MEQKTNSKVIPYSKYFKISFILYALTGIGMAIWGIWSRWFASDENPNTEIVICIFALILIVAGFWISVKTSSMKDKEDELYKENISKTNTSFISFLTTLAMLIVVAVFAAENSGAVSIMLDGTFLLSAIYIIRAVYYGIALYYESKNICGEDE